jgi:hypothetical protein
MKTGKERKADMAARLAAGESAEKIGREYGVSRQRVHNIVKGDPRAESFEPGPHRVSRRKASMARRYLSGSPRALFLSIGPDDWSIGCSPRPDAQWFGTYTAAISIDELHADVEIAAKEMAQRFVRRAA